MVIKRNVSLVLAAFGSLLLAIILASIVQDISITISGNFEAGALTTLFVISWFLPLALIPIISSLIVYTPEALLRSRLIRTLVIIGLVLCVLISFLVIGGVIWLAYNSTIGSGVYDPPFLPLLMLNLVFFGSPSAFMLVLIFHATRAIRNKLKKNR